METKEVLKEQFESLSEKIDNEDRTYASLHFKVSMETINRYIRGEIRKEPFALRLLSFIKDRIIEREKALTK